MTEFHTQKMHFHIFADYLLIIIGPRKSNAFFKQSKTGKNVNARFVSKRVTPDPRRTRGALPRAPRPPAPGSAHRHGADGGGGHPPHGTRARGGGREPVLRQDGEPGGAGGPRGGGGGAAAAARLGRVDRGVRWPARRAPPRVSPPRRAAGHSGRGRCAPARAHELAAEQPVQDRAHLLRGRAPRLRRRRVRVPGGHGRGEGGRFGARGAQLDAHLVAQGGAG